MYTTISTALVAATLLLNVTAAYTQTLGPSALRNTLNATDGAEIDALYAPRPPMVRMWNWGGALNGVNADLKMNAWHIDYPFSDHAVTDTMPQRSIRRILPGARLVMAPSWQIPETMYKDTTAGASQFPWFTNAYKAGRSATPPQDWLIFDLGHGNGPSLIEAQGMRFHPELLVDTAALTPRPGDRQRAVWGFRQHHHGTTTADSTDVNFHRFALTKTGITGWTTVLDQSWPQQEFCEWPKDRQFEQSRSFNGHLMYLGVNVRRTDPADTTMDSAEVLRLRVHYQLADGTQGLVRFDSVPDPNTNTANVAVPLRLDGKGRGVVRPLVARPATVTTTMVITRGMIPSGNTTDSVRDVTIQGHVRLVPEQTHGTVLFDRNFYLRNRQRLGKPIELTSDKDSARIIRLWVDVEYNGQSDVAIDWVQLGTENYTWFTQGYHDETILEGYQAIADNMTIWNSTHNTPPNEPIRIWRWYNRDEGPAAYWNGMGYMHDLFDSRTMTEIGLLDESVWWLDRYLYATGITDVWEGHTSRITNEGLAPYYLRGNGGMDNLGKRTYYHRWGRHSVLFQDTADYDLLITSVLGTPTSLPLTGLSPTPELVDDVYPFGLKVPQAGLQSMIEYNRYLQMKEATYLFRDDLCWIPNVWLSADYTTIVDTAAGRSDTLFVNPRSQIRHLTGEEVRLLAWSDLILGAKGLGYFWGANPDTVTTSQQISMPGDGNFQSYGMAYGPADNALRSPASALARTNQLASYGARDEEVGGDWLESSNSTGLWHILTANQVPVDTALAYLYQSTTPGLFYLGWQSMRSALQSVHDVVAAGENDLDSLHLRAWYHRGFRTWNKGDAALLNNPVNADSVRTRHPLRDSVSKTWTWDTPDSTFVELTVLQNGVVPLDQQFVVGVLNRRASPFLYDTAYIPVIDVNHVHLDTFLTYQQQYEAIAADTTKAARFRQAGARMVEVPFRYRHPDGHWRNLRVQAIGVVTDTSQGIAALDTVIGQDTKLHLKLMPGEGVMLKVTPVQAHTNDAEFGYLDHSNQRKMVAYPKVDSMILVTDTVDSRTYFRQVNGDSMWYHRVYHRRRDDISNGGTSNAFLSVYYQRSQALVLADPPTAPDVNTFDASTIMWEAPILLSNAVIVRENGQPVDTADFSCGYPAIVARFDRTEPVLKAKVYAVFACELPPTESRRVLIAEAVLPAQSARTEQVTYLATHPAEGLEIVAAPDEPMLKHWGTPMINASSEGNYYCWSHATLGIGVGFKAPHERQFAEGVDTLFKRYLPISLGDVASHPSLNSYSKLHLGETDAGLVWQEGPLPDVGRYVMYSRLRVDNDSVHCYLSPDSSITVSGTPIMLVQDSSVAVLEGPVPTINNAQSINAIHRYPALYRHLSDWNTRDLVRLDTLRLVNHKAERVVWETRTEDFEHNLGPWVVGRRVFDIADWSAHALRVDTIWSQSANYIFSDELNLRGPDIAQGEQVGDLTSDPPVQQNWFDYDDSTLVIEFWSESMVDDPLPKIWSLTSGYLNFYGQDQDHDHADLVADGRLRPVSGVGRYPHLAARYSMLANPGWQRNRRIYNNPGGVWTGSYADAPGLATSSQYFYKEGLEGPKVHGFVYRGIRGPAGAALLGPVWVESLQRWVNATEANAPRKSERGTIATPWLTFDAVDDIAVMTKAWSEDDMVGELFIERRSDGMRVSANAVARNQNNKVNRRAHTLLADPDDSYRFILVPTNDQTWPVEDVEIAYERSMRFAKHGERNILDLRSMQQRLASGELCVYPNPAGDRLNVVVNLCCDSSESDDTKGPERDVVVHLSTIDGSIVVTTSCYSTDVLQLDLKGLTAGVYLLSATNPEGVAFTQKVNIVR